MNNVDDPKSMVMKETRRKSLRRYDSIHMKCPEEETEKQIARGCREGTLGEYLLKSTGFSTGVMKMLA